MKVSHIGICSVVMVTLAGCSAMGLGNKRIDYRAAAVQVPTLEMPPDLTAPQTDDRYKVAGADGESVATYSAYSKEEASPSRGAQAKGVLPAVKGVTLERSGTQRWLNVADNAENVWPVVKSFLHDTGLAIQSEDQASGIIVTEWAENRAKISQDAIRNVIGKVFDNMYSSGERDQYRIRMERAKDGASTDIYVTHYGKEEVLDADKNSSKWQSRPNDPELEAELLQRMMIRFGGAPAQAAAVTTGTAAATGAASVVQLADGSSVIVINDAFDKSWRRVGLAIERAGFVVEDKDREKGIYFLRTVKLEKSWYEKLEFWKSEENSDARYRVNVKDGGASCEVSVVDQNGAVSDISRQKLDAIYKHINQ
jgi:outer membrane protein assembly factor BamC